MTSSKPYIIRAIYEWLIDNDLTPHVVVDATVAEVQVPGQFVEDGTIILNISPKACRGLHMGNDRIVFSARFGGTVLQIFTPPSAVRAIYAKETGQGMVFNEGDENGQMTGGNGTSTEPPPKDPAPTGRRKAKLTVVK